MDEIAITPQTEGTFLVRIGEGAGATKHRVTVPKEYFEKFSGKFATPEDFVRASFEFLLAREPKESILHEFSIEVIARYFPEYEQELLK